MIQFEKHCEKNIAVIGIGIQIWKCVLSWESALLSPIPGSATDLLYSSRQPNLLIP